jgi:outer membrane protein assembly factor BamB
VERIGDPGYRSFFMFSTNGRGYTIRADGYAESGTGKGRSINFHLPMGRSGHLVRCYFLEYENDLLLMYELSDQRLGWGYLVRLNEKTLKTKWAIPINGYNIGPALVEAANEVYLSAANFLARLDLTTGKYVWQQADPQKQYPLAFNGFRLPVLDGSRVLFAEERPQGKTVEVERSSGKIIAIRD